MPVYEERSMAPFYIAMGFYMCAQIGIAVTAYVRSMKQSTAVQAKAEGGESSRAEYDQHFAGGKSFGFLVTFLTYFSTSYSGYTVSGIPDEASKIGFISMWWMIAYNVLNGSKLIYHPRLRRLSVVRNWIAHEDPVNDRYNNRLVSALFVFCAAAGQVVYIIVQMYSMRLLIKTITPESDGIDADAVTWVMALLMLFAEVVGGFTSVVFTDSIQSCIMIISMILLPVLATYHFGGAHNSVAPDCMNLETLNCTAGTPLFERGAACKGKVMANGCLAQPTVAPWLTLHPATGMSDYFKPIWKTQDGKPWPEYPCTDSYGNETSAMCTNPLPGSEVLKATRGIDGSWIYNRVPLVWAHMAFTFINIGFMPNFITRVYTADSDWNSKRAALAQVLIGGLIATFPAVLLGIMVSANLSKQYPPGSSAFGTIISDFNNRGGFSQIVSVMAAVGAIAAFMSTADSSVISTTTMITREVLQNGLFKVCPRFDRPIVLKVFAVCCSCMVIITATAVALYDSKINNPESLSYLQLASWQSNFFQFCTIPVLCGIFLPKASDWAVLAGFFAGWATFLVLEIGGWGTNVGTNSFTPFADDPKHIVFRGYFWAFIVNIIVTVPLCFIDIGKWLPTPRFLQINTTQHDPKGQPLRYEQIKSAMEGTREIIKDPIGIACIVLVFLFVLVSIPQFGKSYDGCNYLSYMQWFAGDGSAVDGCEGPNLCGGLPCWIWPCMIFFLVNKLLITFAYTRWKTIEEVEAGFPWGKVKKEEKIVGTTGHNGVLDL